MKQIHSFAANHLYFSIALGIMVSAALIIIPVSLLADVTDRGPSCPSYDRDCDGVPNNCNAAGANCGGGGFELDLDDNDPSVGCYRGCSTGGIQGI